MKRKLNDDARLKETIETLEKITEALTEAIETGKPLMGCCRSCGLNGLKVRSIIPSILKCGGVETADITDYIDLVGPFEKLYMDIFGISENELCNMDLPPDLEETILYVIDESLECREKWILIERYGLADNTQKTLDGIGNEANITGNRVRQIQAKALRKLRLPKICNILKLGLAKYKIWCMEEEERQKLALNAFEEELRTARQEILEEHKSKMETVCTETTIAKACMDISVKDMGMSVRATNCLARAKIESLYELLIISEKDLMRIKNMGKHSIAEIKQAMYEIVSEQLHIDMEELREICLSQQATVN